ncbi:probable G-protein coupled receptor 139 [Leucoraja erinacea]|uniref:probable G-protein coupled receptor 139 n=1 Tax=Leucoraja erinaceus TaxID=7782 RepID=UPI0024589E4E|nr:probable G-protein coupled receptor 139 [Leucoraja erinacea]
MEPGVSTMDPNLGTREWTKRGMERNVFWMSQYIFGNYEGLTVNLRIAYALITIKFVYYPLLAFIAVPVNLVTIVILSRGKSGLSKCVTRYLVAMAAADLLVVVFDVILRQIPIAYRDYFTFVRSIPVCDIHAVLLFTATDCSVWFTVAFTFDRFVAICCQKLKNNYCQGRTAAMVLGTVTGLSFLKNITWHFMLTSEYSLAYAVWFCMPRDRLVNSPVWAGIELAHYLFTPITPFILVLLLNALTIRYVLMASRSRKRLRAPNHGDSARDPEMENRRKSLILLLVISGNFILLWALFTVYYVWNRLRFLGVVVAIPPASMRQLCFMLQLLSCCTNTALYVVTQAKFREQLRNAMKFPRILTLKCIQS